MLMGVMYLEWMGLLGVGRQNVDVDGTHLEWARRIWGLSGVGRLFQIEWVGYIWNPQGFFLEKAEFIWSGQGSTAVDLDVWS